MRILVVGANGALGRATAACALARGWAVDAVVHALAERLPAGLGRVVADTQLAALDRAAYDAVCIAAGFVPYGHMDAADPRLIDANIALPLRICQTFPTARLVLASSIAVYGEPTGVLTETSPFVRPTRYGLSKLAGEAIVRQYPDHAVVRFSSLYGAGMAGDTFVPRILATARAGQPITLFGDGARRQDYLHLTDAADTLLAAAEVAESGVCLGVYGESVSNRAVAELVAAAHPGCRVQFAGQDASPSFVFDAAQTRAALRFAPRIALAQGLQELIRHGK